jgi:Large polyvalent protein associated domain 30/Large polyvalent protein associated domain 29
MKTITTQMFQVGSRVYSGLYGGREGIIFKIHGDQKPDTIHKVCGFMQAGGNALLDVVFENGTISPGIPESIIRGVQWEPRDGIASADEISQALNFASAEKIRRETEAALEKARSVENRARLLAKFGKWLTPVAQGYGGGQHAAKNIRKQLKKAFPTVKFSVTSDYDRISIGWTLGPTSKAVDAICNLYDAGESSDDGDATYYTPSDWTELFGGVRFVRTSRNHPESLHEQVGKDLCALQHVEYNGQWTGGLLGAGDHYDLGSHIHQLLNITSFPVGYEYAGVESDRSDHSHWCKAIVRKAGV